VQENIDAIITYTHRIVGYNSAPEARFFVDVSAALYQEKITGAGVSKFVWLLTMGPAWIALAPVFLATGNSLRVVIDHSPAWHCCYC